MNFSMPSANSSPSPETKPPRVSLISRSSATFQFRRSSGPPARAGRFADHAMPIARAMVAMGSRRDRGPQGRVAPEHLFGRDPLDHDEMLEPLDVEERNGGDSHGRELVEGGLVAVRGISAPVQGGLYVAARE